MYLYVAPPTIKHVYMHISNLTTQVSFINNIYVASLINQVISL